MGTFGAAPGSEHVGSVESTVHSASTPQLHIRPIQTELLEGSHSPFDSVQLHVVPPDPSSAWQCGFSALHPGSVSDKLAVFTQI